MQEVTIREVLKDWNEQDLSNLLVLLGDKSGEPSISKIEEKFKWLYHSRHRVGAVTTFQNLKSRVAAKVSGGTSSHITPDEIKEVPHYNLLLAKAAKHIKAYEGDPTLEECELYLSHAVIIAALQRMSPSQRIKFFNTNIDMDKIMESAKIKSTNLKGSVMAATALGVAQASGFGVFLASTTALGFLTHAIGITLPFAVYTGLTSTIAFVIGPAGWLVAGIWGAWKLTQPKWKHIIPPLLYIVSTNSLRQLRE